MNWYDLVIDAFTLLRVGNQQLGVALSSIIHTRYMLFSYSLGGLKIHGEDQLGEKSFRLEENHSARENW